MDVQNMIADRPVSAAVKFLAKGPSWPEILSLSIYRRLCPNTRKTRAIHCKLKSHLPTRTAKGDDLARGGEALPVFLGKDRECISIHLPFPAPVSLVFHLPINRYVLSSLIFLARARFASAQKPRQRAGNAIVA